MLFLDAYSRLQLDPSAIDGRDTSGVGWCSARGLIFSGVGFRSANAAEIRVVSGGRWAEVGVTFGLKIDTFTTIEPT